MCRAALAFDAALSLCTGRAALEARDLGGREVSPLADGQALSSDRADPHAAELQDGVADRVEHAAYLLVSPLPEHDLEPGVRLRLVQLLDFSRGGVRAIVEPDSAPQARDLFLRRHALDLHLVDLPHVVARRRDVVRQLAVVGQNEQPFGVEVESAHGVQTPERLRHEFRDERAAFGVGECREVAARLVEQDVGRAGNGARIAA